MNDTRSTEQIVADVMSPMFAGSVDFTRKAGEVVAALDAADRLAAPKHDTRGPVWNTIKSFRGGPGEYRGDLLWDKVAFLVAVVGTVFALVGLGVCAVALVRIVGGV